MSSRTVSIQDLALIGDRRTCAYISKSGSIVWYCPGRFDHASLFARLLDAENGGGWELHAQNLSFRERKYLEESAILRTTLAGEAGELILEDWMPIGAAFTGICRTLSAAPEPVTVQLAPKPHYGGTEVELQQQGGIVSINARFFFYASHPVQLKENMICCTVPAGETAWFVLSDTAAAVTLQTVLKAREQTEQEWREVSRHISYQGPYAAEVKKSLRMLRLMTHAESGGIIAAGTTSLPEVLGGHRNYDYRYVWLRDASMIVSALTRAGSDGVEERKFLKFICNALHKVEEPVVPFFGLDFKPTPDEQALCFAGYAASQPVRVGNNANNQLQLDANSNVLLAAKLIYSRFDTREHWEAVEMLADYLANHWHEPDHGLWEETQRQQYTSSKVVAAVSLEYISQFSEQEAQRAKWRKAAAAIREFVQQHCLTQEGAYAVYPGAEAVDVSAILFPIWAYTAADAPEVLKTIEVLERDYCQNHLFRRHLVEFDSRKEGIFLAGTLWVAQYWVMRRNWHKFKTTLHAALRYMNDVGLMPEEGDPETGEFLGNIPQTFVHASLIGAVIDYKKAIGEKHNG